MNKSCGLCIEYVKKKKNSGQHKPNQINKNLTPQNSPKTPKKQRNKNQNNVGEKR